MYTYGILVFVLLIKNKCCRIGRILIKVVTDVALFCSCSLNQRLSLTDKFLFFAREYLGTGYDCFLFYNVM